MFILLEKMKDENLLRESMKPLQKHYGVTKLEVNLP